MGGGGLKARDNITDRIYESGRQKYPRRDSENEVRSDVIAGDRDLGSRKNDGWTRDRDYRDCQGMTSQCGVAPGDIG